MEKFEDIIVYVDRSMKYLGNRWLEDVWPNQDGIKRTLSLLSDPESRDLYCREIVYCILVNFLKDDLAPSVAGMLTKVKFKKFVDLAERQKIHSDIEFPAGGDWFNLYSRTTTFVLEQYQYKDKIKVSAGDVFLDVGACLGDTSIWAIEKGARESYAFEIDRQNLECLGRTISKEARYQAIKPVQKAVGAISGFLWYTPGQAHNGAGKVSSQRPDQESAYQVESVTLDQWCQENKIKPDFIKIDIEGAEPLAIAGARKTFLTHRPKFAICVYHAWEHRWEIPLQLAEMCPGYEFYLKKSDVFCETVLMGRPR